jgi:xenotropic and polytropic retrovirus receptor 1
VRETEKHFFEFLDSELAKIESFYKEKEDQAGKRLALLRDQLHEMRNQRVQRLSDAKKQNEQEESRGDTANGSKDKDQGKRVRWTEEVKSKLFKPGPNSKALQRMDRTPVFDDNNNNDARRDYIRRPDDADVPYRTAKRKLKLALQEFYRGLELLKSYALLNRTAFRKLNKKYDKAVNARPPYRYMNEKVNKSWFVNSDVLDGHIRTVEDLYARYFERGNHKIAAGKLRSLGLRPRDESASAFRNGLFIGIGAVFAVQGSVYGAELLFNEDQTVREQTIYLMQIYGGYFMMLYLFFLFCLDCHVWTKNKVNYPFIFEFDPRHHLDWRQLAEFPSFFVMLFGIVIWLNFSRFGSESMYLYYPVILIFLSALVILFPAPILGHRSRRWFAYAHVGSFLFFIKTALMLFCSGASFSPVCIPWSFATFSWAIFTALSPTLHA